MARYQLLLPKMGESVAEATIIKWNKAPGDRIEADDTVMEIATDKVDSEVPSPVSGTLLEQLCKENDVVQVGAVIATIETGDGVVEEPKQEEKPAAIEQPADVSSAEPFKETAESPEPIPGLDQLHSRPANGHGNGNGNGNGYKNSSRFYSPLVKNIAAQEGLTVEELDSIPGTGAEGRLTKDDLLNYLQNPSAVRTASAPRATESRIDEPKPSSAPEPAKAEPAGKTTIQAEPKVAPAPPPAPVSGSDEIIEMDRMRKLIADHMVMSKQTSPHVTSFVEADVTHIVQWRDKVKSAFEKKEGEKITFTPIFIEAVVKAIKDFPMVNVSVDGNQIIKKSAINVGMATALPSGNLIVPVIKKADYLNLTGLTKTVNDLANRARNNKLQPDEVKDGTFTITNVGGFGNIMGTPIINQPQVAILAVGAIKKKPAVLETPEGDVIAIRHMMFLSLSYDHRVVDGALGGSFLRRIADYLEGWDPERAI
ncbi:MAG TPA: dihydrolipoamide acetyltransferase family protein [Mucilaginibacter sp.]|nr:dihydrolipoamide acetyltransferase family protein [Mucilaginibacter sp.]